MRDDLHATDAQRTDCVRILLTCWSCRHQRAADLQALVDAGRAR
jgi:hypothetical protein